MSPRKRRLTALYVSSPLLHLANEGVMAPGGDGSLFNQVRDQPGTASISIAASTCHSASFMVDCSTTIHETGVRLSEPVAAGV